MSPFLNELDVLEIRLAELDRVVDVFVLCEARQTHSGHQRDLEYPYYRSRFARWAHKIRYVPIDFPPNVRTPWAREAWQREQLTQGLEGLRPDDWIMVTDLNEIPRAEVVRAVLAGEFEIPCSLCLPIHPFRLDWKWDALEEGPCRCTFARGKHLRRTRFGYEGVHRLMTMKRKTYIGEYGWHFTESVPDGIDPHETTSRVSLTELPACVQANPGRYAHILG